MNIRLYNPAPDDPDDQVFWGDHHFGVSFSRALQAVGCTVTMDYWPNWSAVEQGDIVLVLRGLRKLERLPANAGLKIVWLISHPEDVSDAELRQYDIVLSASLAHTRQLRERGINAHAFLQCTDSSVFHPSQEGDGDCNNALVFVGNARQDRQLIHQAIAANLPLKIWGRGWTRANYDKFVAAPSIPNAELAELYRQSYATLNDHWSDMSDLHYINNRVFDALACGLPIISDAHQGLAELQLGGIKLVEQDEPLQDAVDDFLINYEAYKAGALAASQTILAAHTFDARATQLLDIVRGQQASSGSSEASPRPFIIWTFQRTGGTSLAAALEFLSSGKKVLHEPFNKDRTLGDISTAFSDNDTDTATAGLDKLLTEGTSIKHCFELHPTEFNQAILDAVSRYPNYRHLILMRDAEVDRICSLFLAQQTNVWGKWKVKKGGYQEIVRGQRTLDKFPVAQMQQHMAHCLDQRNWLIDHSKRSDLQFHLVFFEELYQGDMTARQARFEEVCNFLNLRVDWDDPLVYERIFSMSQNSESLFSHVKNYADARRQLEKSYVGQSLLTQ